VPGTRYQRADVLPLEEEVWWHGSGRTAPLRQLEEENSKLKQLVADLSLDKHMLQEVITKKL
jgi:hypothetical protein